jgi:photosystem I subunit 12
MFLLGAILTQIRDGDLICLIKKRSRITMALSDTQIFIALAVALIPGIMAIRLSTELYK